MSWQNQMRQSFSNQPASPYPGQVGQPAPLSPIPSSPVPARAHAQKQNATQISPQAAAAAQAAGLGPLTRTFSSSVGGKVPGTGAMNTGLIIGGVCTIGGLLVVLFVVPFPINLISAGITALVILPFLPMILRLTRIFNGGGKSNPFQAWSSQNGLVYTQNGKMHTLRWNEIQQIWRKIGMVNGVMTVIGYMVQPFNAPQFEFSLLGGPYAGLLNAFGGSGAMSISSGAGEVSNYGGFTQISGLADLSAYAGLGDLLEEQMLVHLLTRSLEAFHAGGALSFGRFTIRQAGLSDGSRQLSWNEIDRVQISVAVIQITKKPASLVWFNLSATETPNMALLAAILNTLR